MCSAGEQLAIGPSASESERVIGIEVEYQLGTRLDLRASPALIAASEMLELPSHALESLVHEALRSSRDFAREEWSLRGNVADVLI